MASKKVDTLEDLVAKGMAEFGKVDESATDAEESSINVFSTQEAKQVVKPAHAVETRSSWVIPAKKKAEPAPEPVEEEPEIVEEKEEPVEPEEPRPFRAAPASGTGDWDEAFTPEPEPAPVPEAPPIPKPRIIKEPDSTDLGVEW